MSILGLRCTNKEYTFAVLDGDHLSPRIICLDTIKFPKHFERPRSLHWFYDELIALTKEHFVEAIWLKGLEPMANKDSLTAQHRIENEAIVLLVAEIQGIKDVARVVDVTVASKLGLAPKDKRRQAYELCQEKFGLNLDSNSKDAVLAAWVKMK